MKRKVVIALNAAWNLVNFRSGLIRALVARGYDVVAVAPADEYANRLDALGCRFVAVPMDTHGTHPLRDALLLFRFHRVLSRERPDVFLGFTVKPNVYGSLVAHALGIPVVNNIAGLGAVFIHQTWLTALVKGLYRLALSKSSKVFFQNAEDQQLFISGGIVHRELTELLPGSGVDLERFAFRGDEPARERKGVCFLLIARLLWDKGVGEFVHAARSLRERHPDSRWCLVGFVDVDNPAAIPRAQMDRWIAEGIVSYLGETDDVRPFIAGADCVVLPSYREGTPRALLEAAAMGKAIIATDVAGCRDVVDDGVSGYLCRPRDAEDLADRMRRMITLSPERRAEMGRRGRAKVEREFDEQIVIWKYLDAIERLTARREQGPTAATG